MTSKVIQSVRGMHGLVPGIAAQYSEIQKKAVGVIQSYAYDEIQLPLLEYTDLFARGVGESTDIVEKEMYSLDDRDGVSLSLRPEGTAGCVRALEESGLQKLLHLIIAMPVKKHVLGSLRMLPHMILGFLIWGVLLKRIKITNGLQG